ncbi:hypothetical protein LX36DRAFT_697894 [Colletotrichum falcatum]|nr:hypothetical protein LX36DRAFT_697894 [Colletotrichum falcatum]
MGGVAPVCVAFLIFRHSEPVGGRAVDHEHTDGETGGGGMDTEADDAPGPEDMAGSVDYAALRFSPGRSKTDQDSFVWLMVNGMRHYTYAFTKIALQFYGS